MAKKKKATKRPEVHITITGPQGTGKTTIAEVLCSLMGGVVDGVDHGDRRDNEPCGVHPRTAEWAANELTRFGRLPHVIITTSNE